MNCDGKGDFAFLFSHLIRVLSSLVIPHRVDGVAVAYTVDATQRPFIVAVVSTAHVHRSLPLHHCSSSSLPVPLHAFGDHLAPPLFPALILQELWRTVDHCAYPRTTFLFECRISVRSMRGVYTLARSPGLTVDLCVHNDIS